MIFSVEKFELNVYGSAPELYPAQIFFCELILEDGKRLCVEKRPFPYDSGWGRNPSTALYDARYAAPVAIDIIWYSFVEDQFYSLQAELPKETIKRLLSEKTNLSGKPVQKYEEVLVGMAPYGGLAIWFYGAGITMTEGAWLQAEPIDVDWEDFIEHDYSEKKYKKDEYLKINFMDDCKEAYDNFLKNGLPDRMLYEQYMQKFNYKISPEFLIKTTVGAEMEIRYYSGAFTGAGADAYKFLTSSYNMQAKPERIYISWKQNDIQYWGEFSINNEVIKTFSQIYGDNTSKEADIIIKIGDMDAFNKSDAFLNGETYYSIDAADEGFCLYLSDGSHSINIPTEEIRIGQRRK